MIWNIKYLILLKFFSILKSLRGLFLPSVTSQTYTPIKCTFCHLPHSDNLTRLLLIARAKMTCTREGENKRFFRLYNAKTTFKWMNEKKLILCCFILFYFIFLCQLKYQRIPFYYLHCTNNRNLGIEEVFISVFLW